MRSAEPQNGAREMTNTDRFQRGVLLAIITLGLITGALILADQMAGCAARQSSAAMSNAVGAGSYADATSAASKSRSTTWR